MHVSGCEETELKLSSAVTHFPALGLFGVCSEAEMPLVLAPGCVLSPPCSVPGPASSKATYRPWPWCWASALGLEPCLLVPQTPPWPPLCLPQCLCWFSCCGAWHWAPGGPGTARHLQDTADGSLSLGLRWPNFWGDACHMAGNRTQWGWFQVNSPNDWEQPKLCAQ